MLDVAPPTVRDSPDFATERLEALARSLSPETPTAKADESGFIGCTLFDSPGASDGTVPIALPREAIERVQNQCFVKIEGRDGLRFLGTVVEGPFAVPDGLRGDSPVLVSSAIHESAFLPSFHGRAQVEVLYEVAPDDSLIPPRRRPLPNSRVHLLDDAATAAVLHDHGRERETLAAKHVTLGVVAGMAGVEARVDAANKHAFPRHLGILGTTGGGKSTTVASLVDQLQQAGYAVVLLDTEGEYRAIQQPTEHRAMLSSLAQRNKHPRGIAGVRVHRLASGQRSNDLAREANEFSLPFDRLSPMAIAELLNLNDAQQTRLLEAYDLARELIQDEELGIPVTPSRGRNQDEEYDELDIGHPGLTLALLADVVNWIVAAVSHAPLENVRPKSPSFTQASVITKVVPSIKTAASSKEAKRLSGHAASWRTVAGRLARLLRPNIFDRSDADPIDFAAMLQPGQVHVIDLSDVDAPFIANLAIAYLLAGIRDQQELNCETAEREATRDGSPAQVTPAMVMIEEAHEFLSAQRIQQMETVFQQVAGMARRGRKRWLGLTFITQLPQHLPDEVLGLVNNWVLHKIADGNVINRLKRVVAGVDDGLWRRLPALAPGHAVVAFAGLSRPLHVIVDAAPCALRMAD